MELEDPSILIAPYEHLALQNAVTRELAIRLPDSKTLFYDTMDARPISSGVFATFGEDANKVLWIRQIDVYLAILSVVLPFETHPASSYHLAAMLDTPSLIELWTPYLDANSRGQVFKSFFIEDLHHVWLCTWWKEPQGSSFQQIHGCLQRVLKEEQMRKEKMDVPQHKIDRQHNRVV